MTRIVVNGDTRDIAADPPRSLLHVLREELGLTGPKYGCGEGACGACTVLVDGAVTRACVTGLDEVAGRTVTTVEGLAVGGVLHPVQQAFVAEAAFQCAYCTPGMVMAAVALLEGNTDPADDEIRSALDGNICRCGAYARILAALRHAAQGEARPQAAATSPPDVETPDGQLEHARASPWDLARGGCRCADIGNDLRRREAPVGSLVVGREVGVPQQSPHRRGGSAQLLAGEPDQLCRAPLPHLHLARCDGVPTIRPDV
jgi:nicotinate dehydrogenase subunit A